MSNTISDTNKFLIVVAGPTAVGKTAISIALAKMWDAEIFSADSRQVYREMSIGTAKPSEKELSTIKHHFINHISIHDPYSVGQYESEIKSKLKTYFENKDIAIVCGGTGLYIRALLEGLDNFPEVPAHIRQALEDKHQSEGIQALQLDLQTLDPSYYSKVDIHNYRRLIRALSIIQVSGEPYSHFINTDKPMEDLGCTVIPILLTKPREILYDRINQRVDVMIQNGLLQEVMHLQPFDGIQSLQTVGYQELFQYLDNKISLSGAIEKIKQNSRRYAKRQQTWFAKYGQWTQFDSQEKEQIMHFVRESISFSSD